LLAGRERALVDAWLTHLEDACAVTPDSRAAAQALAEAARKARKQRKDKLLQQLQQERKAAAEERKKKKEAEDKEKGRADAAEQEGQAPQVKAEQQQQAGEGSGADDAIGLLPVGAGCLNIPLEVLQLGEQQQQQQGAGAQLPGLLGTGPGAGAAQEAGRQQQSDPSGAAAEAGQKPQAGAEAGKQEPAQQQKQQQKGQEEEALQKVPQQQQQQQKGQDPYCLVGSDSALHPTKRHFFAAVMEPEFAAAPALHGALGLLKRSYEEQEAVSARGSTQLVLSGCWAVYICCLLPRTL
jgi:hypothetical protein